MLHHRVSCRIRHALGKGVKKGRVFDYLSYTPGELRLHIEKLWEPWMNWDNYGGLANDKRKTWHLDHVKPHSLFPYTSMKDDFFRECWSLSNLRPLEKIANIIKSDNY